MIHVHKHAITLDPLYIDFWRSRYLWHVRVALVSLDLAKLWVIGDESIHGSALNAIPLKYVSDEKWEG